MGGVDLIPLNFFIYKYRWKVTEPALSDLLIQDWHLSVVESYLVYVLKTLGSAHGPEWGNKEAIHKTHLVVLHGRLYCLQICKVTFSCMAGLSMHTSSWVTITVERRYDCLQFENNWLS